MNQHLHQKSNSFCGTHEDLNVRLTQNGAAEALYSNRLLLNAEKTCLIVVDVQPEYWSQAPSIRKDFKDFPTNLKRSIGLCRKFGIKVIWVRACYATPNSPWLYQFAQLAVRSLRSDVTLTIPYSANDLEWEEFATPKEGENIFPKASWNGASNTDLVKWLKSNGIDTVLMCGLITSVCVQHTAFGLFEVGFHIIVVSDCCADRSRERHEMALALYGNYMYETITSKQIYAMVLGDKYLPFRLKNGHPSSKGTINPESNSTTDEQPPTALAA